MDNSGIVPKISLTGHFIFERKIDHAENLCFEMVAMTTSCTTFVWKNDFFIGNMKKRKS